MASEANTKRAEELLASLVGYAHQYDVAGLAAALDAAEQRGREAAEADLRRLRARAKELLADAEREETSTVGFSGESDYWSGRIDALTELLAEHDAKAEEG